MGNLIPINRDSQVEAGRRIVPVSRSVSRALNRLEGRTLFELASVQAEGIVTRSKMREMDASTEDAVAGHTALVAFVDVAAGGNPIVHEECRTFVNVDMAVKRALLQRQGETYLA